MAARVTQHVVEVLCLPARPPIRASQEWIETLRTNTFAPARVSQGFIETLRTNTFAPLRVSQSFVEVLTGTFSDLRMSQHFIEVLLTAGLPPTEMSLANTTSQDDNLAWDFPWELSNTVGTSTVLGEGSPWQLASYTDMDAAPGGDLVPTYDPDDEWELTGVTQVGDQFLSSAPDIQVYANTTTQSDAYEPTLTLTLTTVTGVSEDVLLLVDGRRDLIGTARYRR
jgi:hypothetical protein